MQADYLGDSSPFTRVRWQADLDVIRIEEAVAGDYLGAAPRQGGQVASAMRRRPTFRLPEDGETAPSGAPMHVWRQLLLECCLHIGVSCTY